MKNNINYITIILSFLIFQTSFAQNQIKSQTTSISKNQFVGNYSGQDNDGMPNNVGVKLVSGKLELTYSGGSMEFLYKEKAVKEIVKDLKYLVTTTDVDQNGNINFTFERNTSSQKYTLNLKFVDDNSIKPINLKRDK